MRGSGRGSYMVHEPQLVHGARARAWCTSCLRACRDMTSAKCTTVHMSASRLTWPFSAHVAASADMDV